MIISEIRNYLVSQGYTDSIFIEDIKPGADSTTSLEEYILITSESQPTKRRGSPSYTYDVAIYSRLKDRELSLAKSWDLFRTFDTMRGKLESGSNFTVLSAVCQPPMRWSNDHPLTTYLLRVSFNLVDSLSNTVD